MKRRTRTEHIAWQKYKKWQKDNAELIREGQEINSLREFKLIYNEAGRRISLIKKEVTFQTSFKSYMSFRRAYEEKFEEKLPFSKREARKMSTRELAALLNDEIKDYYNRQIEAGLSPKKAKLAVSQYFFGS